MISLIVAMDKNRLIGKDGKLPWHNKEDLKHFKEYTTGKTLLVGRRTFDGLPGPLPNRKHYVLSRKTMWYSYDNVFVVHDIQNLVDNYKDSEDELVVIGGGEIYKLMMPYINKAVISVINGEYEGDTYFPELPQDFVLSEVIHKNGFDVQYYVR